MWLGDMDEYGKSLRYFIREFGKTEGLAAYMAMKAVEILENGNWEDVANEFYNVLVDYIDE